MSTQRQPTVDLAEERLRSAGVRTTRARRLVIEELIRVDGPHTAEEIGTLLRSAVPLSSLYRTLSVLTASGVLERFHDGAGVARYELAEWLTGHHHHITCSNCGSTQDIDFSSETESTIRRISDGAGATAGFAVTGHRIDLEGLCPQCR
ncbi:MAG TPA: Fur family transcriptional regulator [Acidimicrobiia bacterium]|nr:Fur family transcriptional regulator [Acidimicrobiia bacterium]